MIAPIVACAGISLTADGAVNGYTFIPLMFAMPGSLLLLAPLYAALAERGMAPMRLYAVLATAGGVVGALMLGFVSMGRIDALGWGGLYGFLTAACWIALNVTAKRALGHLR